MLAFKHTFDATNEILNLFADDPELDISVNLIGYNVPQTKSYLWINRACLRQALLS